MHRCYLVSHCLFLSVAANCTTRNEIHRKLLDHNDLNLCHRRNRRLVSASIVHEVAQGT